MLVLEAAVHGAMPLHDRDRRSAHASGRLRRRDCLPYACFRMSLLAVRAQGGGAVLQPVLSPSLAGTRMEVIGVGALVLPQASVAVARTV